MAKVTFWNNGDKRKRVVNVLTYVTYKTVWTFLIGHDLVYLVYKFGDSTTSGYRDMNKKAFRVLHSTEVKVIYLGHRKFHQSMATDPRYCAEIIMKIVLVVCLQISIQPAATSSNITCTWIVKVSFCPQNALP